MQLSCYCYLLYPHRIQKALLSVNSLNLIV